MAAIQWSPSESASINDFLNTPLGEKWLRVLFNLKPPIDRTTLERAALSGAFNAGYEQVFIEIGATRMTPVVDTAGLKPIDPTRD